MSYIHVYTFFINWRIKQNPFFIFTSMSSIVVKPKNIEEFQFLTELLKKLNIEAKVLSDEQVEDLGLSFLMKEADRKDVVSKEEIMSKLRVK